MYLGQVAPWIGHYLINANNTDTLIFNLFWSFVFLLITVMYPPIRTVLAMFSIAGAIYVDKSVCLAVTFSGTNLLLLLIAETMVATICLIRLLFNRCIFLLIISAQTHKNELHPQFHSTCRSYTSNPDFYLQGEDTRGRMLYQDLDLSLN